MSCRAHVAVGSHWTATAGKGHTSSELTKPGRPGPLRHALPEAGDNIAAIDKARGGPMRTLSIANGELWLHADGGAERDLRPIRP